MACLVAGYPSVFNKFTDWDDKGYILSNPLLTDLSWKGLMRIFSEPVMGNYHPLTILSYALEYKVVQLEPLLYHFDNLLLHAMVSWLVYKLLIALFEDRVLAVASSLLFAVHPLHVEAYAWAADRKDLLSAAFYIAALISFLKFRTLEGNSRWAVYSLSLLWFLCAVLSKPVAVAFPLALIAMTALKKPERRGWGRLMEIVPFLALSLVFGLVAVHIQSSGGAMEVHKVAYGFLGRLELGGYALSTYLSKFVLPIGISNFYPYPGTAGGILPDYFWVYLSVIPLAAFVVWWLFRNNRLLFFAASFFLVNIVLLLQFIPVGDAIIADRYAYLPSLGCCIAVGWLVARALADFRTRRYCKWVKMGFTSYLLILAAGANARTRDWYDSGSLWRSVLAIYPTGVPIAFNNLGFRYFDLWQAETDQGQKMVYYDSSKYYLLGALRENPDFYNAAQGLGILYYAKARADSATFYFKKAMTLQTTAESCSDYANILLSAGNIDSALAYYNKSIALKPHHIAPYLGRGRIYYHTEHWEPAEADFKAALAMDSTAAAAYYELSVCRAHFNDFSTAYGYITKAISLGYDKVDMAYYHNLEAMYRQQSAK